MTNTTEKKPIWKMFLSEMCEGFVLMAEVFPSVNIGALFTDNKDDNSKKIVSNTVYTPE